MARINLNLQQQCAQWFRQLKSSMVFTAGLSWAVETSRSMIRAGCDLLYPPRCILCDKDLPEAQDRVCTMFCTACVDRLTPETWKGCPRCGSAIEIDTDNLPIQNCSLCKNNLLWFDAVVPLGSYHTGLRDVILRMKHPTHETLSLAMGRLLAYRRHQALTQWNPNMVIPVPMYWARWLHRGANSPETISDCLASFLKIPVHRRDLVRCRNTKPQKNLKPSERFRNMEGAFGVRSNAHLQNARVLLVDDVLTTGATCSEAAKVLKEAGATSVVVAVIARAQGIHPPKSR